MSNLLVKSIEFKDIIHLSAFDCGNTNMNNFLKQEAYHSHISRKASTSLVYDNGNLVGYFTLTRLPLNIEPDNPEEINELSHNTCLDLTRLAVHKDYQQQGIGTYILKEITKIAYMVNERFISTDALFECWDWYERRGFKYLIEDEIKNKESIIYMMMDLYDPLLHAEFFDEVG